MARYFVIAAILVLAAAIVMSNALGRLTHRPIAIRRGKETQTSGSSNANYGRAQADGPFIADAPWALSALPDCLMQTDETGGKLAAVLAALPKDARPIPAPATLHYFNCTIQVHSDDALVLRGADRLHIPARVRFYRSGGKLILLHEDASGAQLRTYVPSKF